MKLVRYDTSRVGIVENDQVIDISDLVPGMTDVWPPLEMVRLIAKYTDHLSDIKFEVDGRSTVPLREVRLAAPLLWPNKLIAFPANYADHITEMHSSNRATINGFFLKASSSISGPTDSIVLPDIGDTEIHHEAELAIIIGRRGRHIDREHALEHVFGYTCLLDITVRGNQERVMRKSFDSFTPIGPWIVTREEVSDPDNLDISLTVNGRLRQSANTSGFLLDTRGMIEMVSSVATLEPGDIIATGTPAGVGPIVPGDVIEIAISEVGSMRIDVTGGGAIRNRAFNDSSAPSHVETSKTNY